MDRPGIVAFLGSGEAASTGRRVHEWLFKRLAQPVRVAVLETPAGFEPNSAYVAERIAEFLRSRLQNYRPRVDVVPARRRGAPDSSDDPAVLTPLLQASYIFMGPGSPTYAVRHLSGTRAWHTLLARHHTGATLCFASAGAIAAGAYALPVYEIYKAGEDPHWRPGLDLFGPYGLRLAIVTHWNNAEGGAHLDTSRCFMGKARMKHLLSLLPDDATVLGIDEHTGFIMDPSTQSCHILGEGGVTLVRGGSAKAYPSGSVFPIAEMGLVRWPAPGEGIPPDVWREATAGRQADEAPEAPPEEVAALIEQREAARRLGDWALADALRERLMKMGYRLMDTPDGPRWETTDASPS